MQIIKRQSNFGMFCATLCQFFLFFVSMRIIGYNYRWPATFAGLRPQKKDGYETEQ